MLIQEIRFLKIMFQAMPSEPANEEEAKKPEEVAA